MKHRSVGIIAPAILVCVLASCSDGYPKDWPRPAGSWFSRLGACPDLTGDYDDVNWQLMLMFGAASERDRWHSHHARISQADDGSWMHIELGLTAKGMRYARNELPREEGPYKGLGQSRTLRQGREYTCSGGWLYSTARNGVGDDNWSVEDLRFAKDSKGALIAAERIRQAESLRWSDSPSISLGHSTRTRWRHWLPRNPADDAGVRELEGVRLTRAAWTNRSSVPAYFTNFYTLPICARWVRETRTPKLAPFGKSIGNTDPKCPKEFGRLDPIEGTVLQLDLPDPADGILGDYRIEWQRLDRLEQPWQIERVADVRTLPIQKEWR